MDLIYASKAPESLEGAEPEPDCPYYLGTGDRTCKSGCYDEPRCITDEPSSGWGYLPPQHNEPNPVLVWFRNATRIDMAATAAFYCITHWEATVVATLPDSTPDQREHAHRVLTRLSKGHRS